jgi:integrase
MTKTYLKAMKNDGDYVVEEQARKVWTHFKDWAYLAQDRQHIFKVRMLKSLFIYTLWFTGRRVSEVVGIPPFERSSGLRPCDFDFENNKVTFCILKKEQVRRKNKHGTPRKEENIQRDIIKKKEVKVTFIYSPKYVKVMKIWLTRLNISHFNRIFPFNRTYCDHFIKKAGVDLNFYLSGTRFIINKKSKIKEEHKHQLHAHCFRHGFAYNLLKRNSKNPTALPLLQEYLCHEDINTTQTYMSFDDSQRSDVIKNAFGDKIEEVMGDGKI